MRGVRGAVRDAFQARVSLECTYKAQQSTALPGIIVAAVLLHVVDETLEMAAV